MLNFIGWVKNFMKRLRDDHVSAYAAQSAFFIILSFVPFIMILLILLKYVPLNAAMLQQNIGDFFPEKVAVFLQAIINDIMDKTSGTVLSITIVTLVWTAGKGILALTRGLNSVYGISETRNYLTLRIISTFYTFIFAVMIIFTLGFLVFGNQIYLWVSQWIPLLNRTAHIFISMRSVFSMGLLTAVFLIFYKVLPNKRGKLFHQLPGALFSALGWMSSSYIFSIYVDYSDSLSYMYGSLTSIIVAMLWLYFCMYIIFLGAEINILFFPLEPKHPELRY